MLCAYALQANPNDRSAVVLNHTGVVARNTIHLGPQTYIELPVVQFSQIPDVWNGTADSAHLDALERAAETLPQLVRTAFEAQDTLARRYSHRLNVGKPH